MAELQSVQTVPSGLLELLGMKGTGLNPRTLSDSLQGTMDLLQMLGAGRCQLRFANTAAAVAPNSAIVTVPANEVWLLLHADCILTPGLAGITYYNGAVSISYGGSSAATPVAARDFTRGDGTGFALGVEFHIPFYPPRPLILNGGAQIAGTFISSLATTGTAQVVLTAQVAVLS